MTAEDLCLEERLPFEHGACCTVAGSAETLAENLFFAKKSRNCLMLFEYDLNYVYHQFAKGCLKERSILVSEITATTLYHEGVTAG